jgi:hypothetical protein
MCPIADSADYKKLLTVCPAASVQKNADKLWSGSNSCPAITFWRSRAPDGKLALPRQSWYGPLDVRDLLPVRSTEARAMRRPPDGEDTPGPHDTLTAMWNLAGAQWLF